MLTASLASCSAKDGGVDPAITITTSDAKANAEWLEGRLETIPSKLVIGTDGAAYGVDVSSLEDDGYILRTVDGETLIFARTTTGLDMAVRKYAKSAQSNDWQSLDVTYHEGARINSLKIAGRDIADYTVSVPLTEGENAPAHNAYVQGWVRENVAKSFTELIASATGVTLSLSDDGAAATRFIFEQVPETEEFSQSDFYYEVKADGSVLFNYSDIVGAKYAMLMFLQEELGWEDISYGDDYLNEADEIDIPAGTVNKTNAMFDYGLMPYNSYDPPSVAFSNTAQRINYGMYRTFYKIPCAMHGMSSHKWPGYVPGYEQICYTNESTYQASLNNILDYIERQLEAGAVIGETLTTIDVAQTDAFGYCGCNGCKKVLKEENGFNSGPVVRWINRLAEDVEAEGYGGLKYTFFAYHGSNVPPVTKCRDDVYVTFCTDGHCSRHFLDGSQCQGVSFDMCKVLPSNLWELNNTHYADWIRGWNEKCPNVYVWFYALDNNVHQYTIIDQMYEDFKFLSENGAKGIFWQIPYHGLGIVKIEQQLGMLMNLHPDMTKEQFRDETARLVRKTYGDGWAEIMEYLDLWEDAEMVVNDCWNCWDYGDATGFGSVDGPTYLKSWERMIELLDTAIYKANSAAQEAACEVLSVSMLYLGCFYSYFDAYMNKDTARLELLDSRYDLLVERLTKNGFDINAIVGVDNGKSHIHDDINVQAWTDWAPETFKNFYPDVDIKSLNIPEEWIAIHPEVTP